MNLKSVMMEILRMVMDVQQTVPPYKLVINAIILVRIVVQIYVEMEKKMVFI